MATTLRPDAKKQIIKTLQEQGYPTYARLVNLFDIYLTDDPTVVGYMIPGKAKIVLNAELNIHQVSTIIRHEVLHEYFTHAARRAAVEKESSELGSDHELANIAADYEISNRGYTDEDKATARAIILGDRVLKGLVTEDQYPEWTTLSFEEMYKKLLQQKKEDKSKLEPLVKKLSELSKREDEDNDDSQQASSPSMPSSANDDSQQASSPSMPSSANDDSQQASSPSMPSSANDDSSDSAPNSDNTPLDTPEEQKARLEKAARVAEIEKAFKDPSMFDGVMKDVSDKKREDNIRRAKRNAVSNYAKNGNGGLNQFKLDLQRFISKQVAERDKEDSYEIFNPSYEGSDFIMPGKWQDDTPNVPIINVYWDTSGSFSDPQKTAAARAAINSIQSYVKKGLIEINTYYHSDTVSTSPISGSNNGNAVMEHIKETEPDNVIIITDGDLRGTSVSTIVSGAVWMLFYDSTSSGLIKNLKGKKQTKWYMIEYK